jgi:hypothetical protein
VDHAVRRGRSPAQALRVVEGAAVRSRPGRGEHGGGPGGAGEADDLVARLLQLPDDGGTDEAGRARVAQPSLSRQIRRLERQVGARLLDRTPQGSRLTEAGEVFLPCATALLRSADRAAGRARAAAEPSRITVGFTGS